MQIFLFAIFTRYVYTIQYVYHLEIRISESVKQNFPENLLLLSGRKKYIRFRIYKQMPSFVTKIPQIYFFIQNFFKYNTWFFQHHRTFFCFAINQDSLLIKKRENKKQKNQQAVDNRLFFNFLQVFFYILAVIQNCVVTHCCVMWRCCYTMFSFLQLKVISIEHSIVIDMWVAPS